MLPFPKRGRSLQELFAPSPGPMKVPAGELRNYLGIASVTYLEHNKPLAIVDTSLAG